MSHARPLFSLDPRREALNPSAESEQISPGGRLSLRQNSQRGATRSCASLRHPSPPLSPREISRASKRNFEALSGTHCVSRCDRDTCVSSPEGRQNTRPPHALTVSKGALDSLRRVKRGKRLLLLAFSFLVCFTLLILGVFFSLGQSTVDEVRLKGRE